MDLKEAQSTLAIINGWFQVEAWGDWE